MLLFKKFCKSLLFTKWDKKKSDNVELIFGYQNQKKKKKKP